MPVRDEFLNETRSLKELQKLVPRRATLDAQIVKLTSERDAIARRIGLLKANIGGDATVQAPAEPREGPPPKGRKKKTAKVKAGRGERPLRGLRPGSLVANVVALLAKDPRRIWKIEEIWDGLEKKPKNRGSLGSQLRLWVQQGRVHDAGRGLYRSAFRRRAK